MAGSACWLDYARLQHRAIQISVCESVVCFCLKFYTMFGLYQGLNLLLTIHCAVAVGFGGSAPAPRRAEVASCSLAGEGNRASKPKEAMKIHM